MNIRDIVMLWYKTRHGHRLKCAEAHSHFIDVMYTLYNEMVKDEEDSDYECTGDHVI